MTLVPRTDRSAKETVTRDGVAARVPVLLDEIQQTLYDQALAFRESRTFTASDFDTFKALMADKAKLGFVEGWWCGDAACEAAIKAETQATIRGLPLERSTRQSADSGTCVRCDNPATAWAVYAKAY